MTSSLPAGGLGHRELLMFRVSHVSRHLQILVAVMVSGRWRAREGITEPEPRSPCSIHVGK